jgi:two-component system CheB/CheR fusion protein
VIVNEQLDIVQFRGSTRAYLEAPAGKATLNVLKMARQNLSHELRTALHEVRTNNETVIKSGIVLEPENRVISIEVIPLLTTIEPYFFILFHDDTPTRINSEVIPPSEPSVETQKDARDIRIQNLEKEVVRVKSEMRNMNEEQEAANEELQSANEELLSGSEELQSLNEELETTREEIQSTNEELSIVNHELVERNGQLNLSRQFAEAVVTTLHEPLLILNQDLRIVRANQAFYETFNLQEAQTIGKILFELQDSQWDIPALRKHLFEIQTSKATYKEWQVTCNFKEFGEMHLDCNAQPIQDNNEARLILLAIEDITLRRQEEERQKIFSDELEKQILERTLSLKKVNIELERSNENLNQFVFIASHDLQEPLRKLQIFVDLLRKDEKEVPDNVKRLVDKIGNSAERMSNLIRDVLTFSTITSIESAYVRTDLNLIFQKILSDLDLLISEKEAVVSIETLPVIKAVPVLIGQLFNNLLSNSLKFAREETLTITVSSRTLSPQEVAKEANLNTQLSYCEIMVKDNGIGFEQHFAEKVFVIFQRLESSSYPGTGIGLALCKKIVSMHEGNISAESEVGKGATFIIHLPLYHEGSVRIANDNQIEVTGVFGNEK